MNKQAFTFLTLFSLVLMMTIYYVTLPVEKEEIADFTSSTVSTNQEENDSMDILVQALQDKREALTKQYNAVLADSTASESEKQNALSSLNDLEIFKQKEEMLANLLNSAGYEQSFIEIKEEIIHVTCLKKYKNTKDVAQIIKIIQANSEEKYTVEVSFKE